MTNPRDESGLREQFGDLRRETTASGRVPDFDAMLARARAEAAGRPGFGVIEGGASGRSGAPTGRRFVRAGAWISAAVAATVAGLLLTDRRPRNDDEFLRVVAAYSGDVSGGAWRSPTSGLLDVPGMNLVRSLPEIGGSLRGVDPATLPPPESVPPDENL